jgi:hypothetical protein
MCIATGGEWLNDSLFEVAMPFNENIRNAFVMNNRDEMTPLTNWTGLKITVQRPILAPLVMVLNTTLGQRHVALSVRGDQG